MALFEQIPPGRWLKKNGVKTRFSESRKKKNTDLQFRFWEAVSFSFKRLIQCHTKENA